MEVFLMPNHTYRPDNDDALERDTIIVEDELLREGFTQVPNILLRKPDLTHGAKLAYALLLSYAWGERRCFPGQEQLSVDMGVERKAVIRYLKELKDKQIIRVERRGMGKTNVYYLPRLTDVPKMGHLDVPPRGRQDVPPVGQNEYSSTKTQKEEYTSSNLRMAKPVKKNSTGDLVQNLQAPEALSGPSTSRGLEAVGDVLGRHQHRDRLPKQPAYDEDREVILAYISDFSREFADRAPLKSSTTRALNLYRRSGVERQTFLDALYQARATTKERAAAIHGSGGNATTTAKNKMAYFFSVLEDGLGLKDDAADSATPH